MSDVTTILEQLRAEVQERRKALAEHEREDDTRNALERQLQRCGEQLEITRVVSAHWPIESRSLFERVLGFIQKVVRRFLRWYINPIVEQQNAFNDTTARTLRLLIEAYSDLLRQGGTTEAGDNNPQTDTPAAVPHTSPGNTDRAQQQDLAALDTQQLQALIEERGRAEPPATFPDLTLRPFITRLEQRQAVHAHWPLDERTTFQRVAAFIQKVTRFLLRWYLNPVVEQQNYFNAAVTAAITPLLAVDTEVRVARAAQRARNKQQQKSNKRGGYGQ